MLPTRRPISPPHTWKHKLKLHSVPSFVDLLRHLLSSDAMMLSLVTDVAAVGEQAHIPIHDDPLSAASFPSTAATEAAEAWRSGSQWRQHPAAMPLTLSACYCRNAAAGTLELILVLEYPWPPPPPQCLRMSAARHCCTLPAVVARGAACNC